MSLDTPMADTPITGKKMKDAVTVLSPSADVFVMINGDKTKLLNVRAVSLDCNGDLILDVAHFCSGEKRA